MYSYLNDNQISIISGLEGLISLKRLDLSFNKIRKLENLEQLTALESLDVRGNLIDDLSDLKTISNVMYHHHPTYL